MAAGIIELCDQVVSLIEAAWGPTGNDSVERLYTAPVSVSELNTLVGRKVYVFPGRKLSIGAASRGEDRFNWSIGIVAVERCEDPGTPPIAWTDERVLWMEGTVEAAVDFDARDDHYMEFSGRTLWTLSIETDIYDADKHDEDSMFWSTMEVVFDEISEA